MFHTWHAGADCINPAAYNAIRANGDKAWFGWPDKRGRWRRKSRHGSTPRISTRRRRRSKRLNKAAIEDVVYAPTGFFLSYTAWRKNVSGIAKGPLPVLLGRVEIRMTAQ